MTMPPITQNGVGTILATRLGLKITKREGHDLAGPCVHCESSDAFRVHQDTGVAYCYSCNSKWSPFRLAEDVLGNCEDAKSLMVELGVMQPTTGSNGQSNGKSAKPPNPIDVIAQQKRVSPGALKVYGAKAIGTHSVKLPAYGPDGARCTMMSMSARGGKGKFDYGKPAGLFFPHDENGVRVPQPGETWYVVEGPKDAAALHDLGLLAVGLNTCRLAAKFARLFADVDVVLVPDRDRAGEEGAEHSARVLRGVAASVRVAALPSESKDSGGDDVRDILRRPDGR